MSDSNSFSCDKCNKVFKTISKFNYHQKDYHPADEALKQCKLCNKVFSSGSTRQRHEDTGCRKELEVVWIPPAVISKEENNSRHVIQRNELSDKNLQIIDRFREYLTDGSTSVVILSRGKQNLEPSSVESYVSHFRVYAGFVQAANPSHDVVDCVLRIKTIKDFIKFLSDSNYKQKTILNRLLAIERFCGFIDEKLDQLNASELTARKPSKQTKTLTTEALTWISAQLRVLRPIATKETLVRNSREVYEQEGRWITPQKLFEKEQELREHVDILMEQLISNANRKPTMADLQSIQRFLLFVLVIRRPPMRAQNFNLVILEKVENPKEAKHNAVVFEGNDVILQYSQYKTKSAFGFTKFYLSEFLASYVKKFVKHVRPWFYPNKDEVPYFGSSLFTNQIGKPLQDIGRYFMETMELYFNQRIEISTIRKVMETAVSDCNQLSDTDKDKLSTAMLHDPETAKRYYVAKDSKSESAAINAQWDKLYLHYAGAPAVERQVIADGQSNNNCNTPPMQINLPQLELIPTSSLYRPVAPPVDLPSLVSEVSTPQYSPVREPNYSTREIAATIASQLVSPSKKHVMQQVSSSSTSKAFTRRVGDWYCSVCGYDNFAYRTTCKHCSTPKEGKKRAAEADINPSPNKKAKEDITSVLDRSVNKDGEVIFKVLSKTKGTVWVRAKHVPADMQM